MALSFIVETGEGVPGANSYVSVEEADEYLEANIHVFPTWSALSVEEKQALLVWATRYLDQRADWIGCLSVQGSSLRWPRTGAYDLDGNVLGALAIPQQLKWAVIEMAIYLIAADPSAPSESAGLDKLKVDVIELTFTANFKIAAVPNNVIGLLFGLGVIRGVGGYAKIKRS